MEVDVRLDRLWRVANQLRAELDGTRLGFRLEELLIEIAEYEGAEAIAG
ncbi:MAG: hypothetical protein AB1778_02225 [Candidatus Bipolaricaulota bacterium]